MSNADEFFKNAFNDMKESAKQLYKADFANFLLCAFKYEQNFNIYVL